MTLVVMHRPTARSHRRSGHSQTSRSFRDGGLYIDRSATGAVIMAWDKAQREDHEWVPLDNVELQLWFAGLPNYISASTRCRA
ncbi:MAG: hypothetical protein K2X72_00435 [Reyranella sp.]|nr:hypothetical protein [Reyranella sp.]